MPKDTQIRFQNAISGEELGLIQEVLPYTCTALDLHIVLGHFVRHFRTVPEDRALEGLHITEDMMIGGGCTQDCEVVVELVLREDHPELTNSWRPSPETTCPRGWRKWYKEFRIQSQRVMLANPPTELSVGFLWAGHEIRELSVLILQWQADELRHEYTGPNGIVPEDGRSIDGVLHSIVRRTDRSKAEARDFVQGWLVVNHHLVWQLEGLIMEEPWQNFFE